MAEDITFATPAEQAVTVSDKGMPKSQSTYLRYLLRTSS